MYENQNHPEPCVKCDVENCIHNNHQCCCTAKEIKVGPQYATAQCDTVCATFKAQK